MNDVTLEAQLFSRYLIGRPADDHSCRIFYQVVADQPLNARDSNLLAFVIRHPWAIGLIDAGLVFYSPYSQVRQRLYIMLAILETSPQYSTIFLPKQRNFLYIFVVGLSGLRAIGRVIAGSILVRLVRP
jgi:hypothetical protein